MRDERKKQASLVKQTNKAKQHSTPKCTYKGCVFIRGLYKCTLGLAVVRR